MRDEGKPYNKVVDEKNNQNLIDLSLLYFLGMIEEKTLPEKIRQFTANDWGMLIWKAIPHKVAPLLYCRLSNDDIRGIIPDYVIQRLHRIYLENSLKNTQMYHVLKEVLRKLESEGVQVIVMKGLAIAGLVYENIALRPMGDIDLLMRSKDISRIDKILSDLGWINRSAQLISKNKKRLTGDITYENNSTFIDLHTRSHIMPKFDPWEDISYVEMDGFKIPTLRLNDFLLHLCLHVNDHVYSGFSELVRLCDLIEMIKKFSDVVDWGYIERTAKINNAEDGLYHALYLVSSASDINLPFNIMGKLKKDGFCTSIYDLMYITRQKTKNPMGYSLMKCLNSEILPFRYKAHRVLKLFCPDKEYMIYRYNPKYPGLFFLYYPVRLLVGITRFMRGSFGQHDDNFS